MKHLADRLFSIAVSVAVLAYVLRWAVDVLRPWLVAAVLVLLVRAAITRYRAW